MTKGIPTRRSARNHTRIAILGVIAALFMNSSSAWADPKADAEALYREGMRLMQAGAAAEACPKLAESQRLDPALGTEFRLAECYEATGRLASAWSLFRDVEGKARAAKLLPQAQKAGKRADGIEPKLGGIAILVPESLKALKQLTITRDGEDVSPDAWGVSLPVDPGAHTVRVTAEGKLPWTREISAAAGEKARVEIGPLLDAPSAPPPPAPPPTNPDSSFSRVRILAIAAGGAGVLSVIAGGALGGLALSRDQTWNDMTLAHCDASRACDAASIPSIRAIEGERSTFATASTITFAAGGALVAAGVALWLISSPKAGAPSVGILSVAPGAPGAAIRASF